MTIAQVSIITGSTVRCHCLVTETSGFVLCARAGNAIERIRIARIDEHAARLGIGLRIAWIAGVGRAVQVVIAFGRIA
jgi:hypothetical protein